MKRLFLTFFLLIVILFSNMSYLKSQTFSSEGRDFYIALTKFNGAESSYAYPFIIVTSRQSCSVTITNPNQPGWEGVSADILAGGSVQFTTVDIPLTQWCNNSFDTAEFQIPQPLGLQLTSTQDVAVYVAARSECSFDATKVLPIEALTGTYVIQDYPASDYNDRGMNGNSSTFCIVATEDNTSVSIVPSIKTRCGDAAGSTIQTTLQRGQVYHVISEDIEGSSFTGTKISADKNVAVFAGAVFTSIPGNFSARDLLYEQQIPTDYLGTEFVVTRSLDKYADRVRMTALYDNTEIAINGISVKMLNAGETFEIELSDGDARLSRSPIVEYDYLVRGTDAHYIQSSCPIAVYLYMVSNAYRDKNSYIMEIGDPAMVWIAPLDQMIGESTFPILATDKTSDHYVNIVTRTDNVHSMQLINSDGLNILSESDFQPVLGNPEYSYTRRLLYNSNKSAPTNELFTLKGRQGFVAQVYGNGDDESYAYSVGSVFNNNRGIVIDNKMLSDGDELLMCLGKPVEFNLKFPGYSIDKFELDMGDGVVKTFSHDTIFDYQYDSKGWYDIIATYSLTNNCTGAKIAHESTHVKLYVNVPDTVMINKFIAIGDSYNGKLYDQVGTYIDTINNDCSTIEINKVVVADTAEIVIEDSCSYSGVCGASLRWHLSCDGVMTISGIGEMSDYGYAKAPWNEVKDQIRQVEIAAGVTTIGTNAFSECRNIISVSLPNSLKTIKLKSFYDCRSLENITLPEGVTYIGEMAFMGSGLKNIYLSQNVRFVGNGAFSPLGKYSEIEDYSDKLESIEVSSDNQYYSSIDGVLYNKLENVLVAYPSAKNNILTIPADVDSILSYAVCGGIDSVVFSEGLGYIGTGAFITPKLRTIKLPNSLTKIDAGAFMYCYGISELSIGDDTDSIGGFSFVLDLEKINAITCLSEDVPYIDENVLPFVLVKGIFWNNEITDYSWEDVDIINYKQLTVRVPKKSIEDYTNSTWGRYYTIEPIEDPVVQYTLTLNVSNPVEGSVFGAGKYDAGTEVTISATANAGYEFVCWSDGNTDNPRTIILTEDMTLQALFSEILYAITVNALDSTMGTTSGSGQYPLYSLANILAQPYIGYEFVCWTDGNQEDNRNVMVLGDADYTAVFAKSKVYHIEVLSANDAMGAAFGTGDYPLGAEVTLDAVPKSGYHFVRWQDDNTDNPRIIKVVNNATYYAYFWMGTGIENHELKGLSVDGMQLKIDGYEGVGLRIYTSTGQMIYSGDVQPVISLPWRGVYIIQIGDSIAKIVI